LQNLTQQAAIPDWVEVVDWTMETRHSVRRFLPRPVPRWLIEEILRISSRAPSGTNVQPWCVHVLTGESLASTVEALLDRVNDPNGRFDPDPIRPVYPAEWTEPYGSRRKKLGIDLYGLLGIARGEREKMRAQMARNFRFFDAPVGLIFSIEKVIAESNFIDGGIFMQNVMLAARVRGLDTCPQAAFVHYHKLLADRLGFAEGEMVFCGMSLGYADPDAPENSLRSQRVDLPEFVTFHE
jgi:nitroreductase